MLRLALSLMSGVAVGAVSAPAAVGAAAMLTGEANGYASDFTYTDDAKRTAVKASSVTTEYATDAFYSNAGTSPKRRWDATGTLVWSPHNMLLESASLATSPWTGSATCVANVITDDNAAAFESWAQAVTLILGATYTYTVWVLKDNDETRTPLLRMFFGSGQVVDVNLNTKTGAVPKVMPGASTAVCESDGLHWKLTYTGTVTTDATGSCQIFPGGGSAATAVGSITVDKVQLNRGLVATAYLATTSAARFGLAIDHDPATLTPKGLLVEPAATNLVVRSQQFDHAVWTPANVSVAANDTVAPDGTATADKLTSTTAANDEHRVRLAFDYVVSTSYTISCYAKNVDGTYLYMRQLADANTGNNQLGIFNLATGVVVFTGSSLDNGTSIESVGNGWYRCSIKFTTPGAIDNALFDIGLTSSASALTSTAAVGTAIYLWGLQIETGSVATSYIETFGSTVTRAKDGSLISAAYNPGSEYSLLFIGKRLGGGQQVFFELDDTTDANRSGIWNDDSNDAVFVVASGGTSYQLATGAKLGAGVQGRHALRSKTNDFRAARNGTLIAADTVGAVPTVSRILFGFASGSYDPHMYVEKVMVVKRGWSDAELQSLTA